MNKQRSRNENGIATVEMALVFPIMFTVMFLALQIGFYWHGSTVATAAAQEGVRAATGRINDNGTAAARTFATTVGKGALSNVNVSSASNTRRVSITVTADTISLVPGLTLTVNKTSTGPIERFTG